MSIDAANKAANDFTQSKSKWVRVIAGPGTGKSSNLKKRLTWLVNEDEIKPEQILVLTFTSIAVQDLKKDITALGLGDIEVSTLHSLAMRILESEKKQGRLLLDFEITTMLYDLEPEIGKVRNKKAIRKQIQVKTGLEDLSDEEKKLEAGRNKWLKQHHGLDLNDVISEVCGILKNNNAAKKRWRYSRILVDEYQDLNEAEQEFVDLLVAPSGKLTVIGDDDQSIYEFKGAYPDGIRLFPEKHPKCEDIRFAVCFRCPKSVVKKAETLIKHNRNRIDDKEFEANPDFTEGEIQTIISKTPEEEIEQLCMLIQEESKHINVGQIVVLVPVKERGRKLHDALQESGIPTLFCFRDFDFNIKENRNAFSYLTLAADPEDLISWRYLLGCDSKDRRSLSYKRILEFAKKEKTGILETLDKCISGEVKIPYTSALVSRYSRIKPQVEQIRAKPTLLLNMLNNNTHFMSVLDQAIKTYWSSGGPSAVRTAILDAVFSTEAIVASENVRIMSLHAAKGLSAKIVIIMSAVESLIPLASSGTLEEQRRLFYVAITRCKGGKEGEHPGKLIISAFRQSENGDKEYTLTRFLQEMEPES